RASRSAWGTTPSDRTRVMPGDGLLVNATYSGSMAVDVDAPPEHIWPWLVQIGYQRGGLYSYDWLDRPFRYPETRRAPLAAFRSFRASPLATRFLSGEGQAGRWPPSSPIARSCWICVTWAPSI